MIEFRWTKDRPRDGRMAETFDFTKVPDVDDKTVEAFFASTHEGARRMPLLVAGYVAAEYEARLTAPGRMDGMQLAEIRGALTALRRFANFYQTGIEEWKKKGERRG